MRNFASRFDDFEIIDFHTHPFASNKTCICVYRHDYEGLAENMLPVMQGYGISKMCGAVIHVDGREDYPDVMTRIKDENREALKLRESSGGYVIPGFHIHPDYVDESLAEIEFMHERGVNLIGELVPYMHEWERYDRAELHPILELAGRRGMVVSFHNMAEDSIDEMVKSHPDVMFVAAHPGEHHLLLANVERLQKYENLCLDISGTGIFRFHALRYIVDKVGSERVLFGTDYPVCNPGVYIGGVLSEPLRDFEYENIFSKNAKRLLNI